MFKNETHNHPTEIEPFGGAATCIGGCIRDPLSGRAYVYQAMRVTGGGDPRMPLAETLPGKLPQRKLVTDRGGGLLAPTATRSALPPAMSPSSTTRATLPSAWRCGAVVAAAPAKNVVRERPAPGDVVILLGGRTGRDGMRRRDRFVQEPQREVPDHHAAREVQKGNAPEERKTPAPVPQRRGHPPHQALQRLRRGRRVRRHRRAGRRSARSTSTPCRKKYEGLDGTELAISESQERMAVVVAPEDADDVHRRRAGAKTWRPTGWPSVTESPRMVMHWRGQTIADLSPRLPQHQRRSQARTHVAWTRQRPRQRGAPLARRARCAIWRPASRCASRRGLTERFDSTIGAGSVLMPFGGKTQRTPVAGDGGRCSRCCRVRRRDQASVMAWGCDPDSTERRSLHRRIQRGLHLGREARRRRCRLPESLPHLPGIFREARATSPSAGASPLPRCSARWTPSLSSAPPPSAARTRCPARS